MTRPTGAGRRAPGSGRRWVAAGVLLLIAGLLAAPVAAQEERHLRTPECVLGIEDPLHDVRDVAITDDRAVILTAPDPAVHAFSVPACRLTGTWGAKGDGPGELDNPVAVVANGGAIHILDLRPGASRVTEYDEDGAAGNVHTISEWTVVDRLVSAGRKLYVQGGSFADRGRVVGGVDAPDDPLFEFARAEPVRLTASDGPVRRMEFRAPFAAEARWTGLPDGRIVRWPGEGDVLIMHDSDGREVATLPLPAETIPVREADREAWLERTFSPDQELLGIRDPYRAFRVQAGEAFEFPSTYPPVLDLLPDPVSGVWVLRADSAAGQRWSLVRESGERLALALPPGRRVAAVGRTHLAATTRDEEYGVELVELYRWRRFASQDPLAR